MKKHKFVGILFICPSLVGVSIFVLLPFLDVLYRSFCTAVSGEFTGFSNYKIIFANPAFLLACKNTVRFVAVCIPLLLILSLGIAVVLYSKGRAGRILKSLYLLPMAVPVASVVLMWKLLFHNQGIINGIMAGLRLETIDWMNSQWAFGVLVFSYLWKNLGYGIVLWIAGLSTIPGEIYEAAKVDGAGAWICFLRITMPNLIPALYTISVLSLLNSFKVFREAYLVAGDYPHESMYLLQHLFNNWYRELSLDKMAAAAVVSAAVICIFVLLLERSWREEQR